MKSTLRWRRLILPITLPVANSVDSHGGVSRAIERLDLALRVPAKHQRLLRGVRIEDEGATDAPGQTGRATCSPFAGLCDDAQRSPRPTGPPHDASTNIQSRTPAAPPTPKLPSSSSLKKSAPAERPMPSPPMTGIEKPKPKYYNPLIRQNTRQAGRP